MYRSPSHDEYHLLSQHGMGVENLGGVWILLAERRWREEENISFFELRVLCRYCRRIVVY